MATGPDPLNPLSVSSAGQPVIYTYVVTNTGTVPLNNVTLFDDVQGSIAIGTTPVTLAPAQSVTVTSTHIMLQPEIDNITLTNLATVTGTATSGQDLIDTDNQSVIAQEAPNITLFKTGSLNLGTDGIATPGDIINYSFTVTNGGNLTLSNVTVADTVGGVTISGTIASLAPGAVDTSITGTYAITQADIDAGVKNNTATAAGTDPSNNAVVSSPALATVQIPQTASISVTKTPDIGDLPDQPLTRAVGDTVTFSYTVTNTGNVSVENVSLSDDLAGC